MVVWDIITNQVPCHLKLFYLYYLKCAFPRRTGVRGLWSPMNTLTGYTHALKLLDLFASQASLLQNSFRLPWDQCCVYPYLLIDFQNKWYQSFFIIIIIIVGISGVHKPEISKEKKASTLFSKNCFCLDLLD